MVECLTPSRCQHPPPKLWQLDSAKTVRRSFSSENYPQLKTNNVDQREMGALALHIAALPFHCQQLPVRKESQD